MKPGDGYYLEISVVQFEWYGLLFRSFLYVDLLTFSRERSS
jgi:hypothetical protein